MKRDVRSAKKDREGWRKLGKAFDLNILAQDADDYER